MNRHFHALPRSATVLLCCVLALCAAAHGDDSDAPFLPSEVKSSSGRIHSFDIMSNHDLLIRADQMRHADLTPSQRAMNYQWLSQHSGSEDAIHGEKAVTKLIERHLKGYVDRNLGGEWIKQKLMPDSRGQGFIKRVDYDFKVRANRLVIGVTYEF